MTGPCCHSCTRTENQNAGPHVIYVLIERTLGHLHDHLTDVPPQLKSPPDYVFRTSP